MLGASRSLSFCVIIKSGIKAQRTAAVTRVMGGCTLYLQTGVICRTCTWQCESPLVTPFPVHNSCTVLPFDALLIRTSQSFAHNLWMNEYSAPFITFSLFSNIYYYSELRLLSLSSLSLLVLLLLLLEKAGQLSRPLQAKGWMSEMGVQFLSSVYRS